MLLWHACLAMPRNISYNPFWLIYQVISAWRRISIEVEIGANFIDLNPLFIYTIKSLLFNYLGIRGPIESEEFAQIICISILVLNSARHSLLHQRLLCSEMPEIGGVRAKVELCLWFPLLKSHTARLIKPQNYFRDETLSDVWGR